MIDPLLVPAMGCSFAHACDIFQGFATQKWSTKAIQGLGFVPTMHQPPYTTGTNLQHILLMTRFCAFGRSTSALNAFFQKRIYKIDGVGRRATSEVPRGFECKGLQGLASLCIDFLVPVVCDGGGSIRVAVECFIPLCFPWCTRCRAECA